MTFYKVVCKRDADHKDLRSAVDDHDFVIKYKTQRWRKPVLKNSKIFVFGSLDNAKHFVKKQFSNNLTIYECEVRNPVMATFYAFYANTQDILDCWKNNVYTNLGLPHGTYHCDAVKLTKKVI